MVVADALIQLIDSEWEAFNACTLGDTPVADIPELSPIRDAIYAALLAERRRAEAAMREREQRLLTALKSVLDACDQGRIRPAPGCGVGGMTIEANIKGSIYTGVPAWPIEEARDVFYEIRATPF